MKSIYPLPMAPKAPITPEVLKAAKSLGRPITEAQGTKLAHYLGQLIKWNQKMNLVGRSTWRDVMDTLVVDSLYLADFLSDLGLKAPLTLDLGAGAGLPGIPLRAIWQDGEYWLVELREKRSLFMRSVLGKLQLPETKVFHGRAEEALDGIEAETADLILSRAFMPWKKLLGYTHPMLTGGGTIVILSNDPPPDQSDIPNGWQLRETASYPAAKTTRHFWALIKA